MFARFDEIPSLPVKNIKEKPKRRRQMNGCESSTYPTNTVCGGYKNTHVAPSEKGV